MADKIVFYVTWETKSSVRCPMLVSIKSKIVQEINKSLECHIPAGARINVTEFIINGLLELPNITPWPLPFYKLVFIRWQKPLERLSNKKKLIVGLKPHFNTLVGILLKELKITLRVYISHVGSVFKIKKDTLPLRTGNLGNIAVDNFILVVND